MKRLNWLVSPRIASPWAPRIALILLFAGGDLVQPKAFAQASIPDTPAGVTLRTWLNAFNSNDRVKIEAYVRTVDPSQAVDGMLSFRKQTTGFQLISIESSEPLHIRFLVKENTSSTTDLGNLIVKEGSPPSVEAFTLTYLPPGVTPIDVLLDVHVREKVIEGVNTNLLDSYIDAEGAQKMVNLLLANQNAGRYDSITDGDAFAKRLTDDLQSVSHDKHLEVTFNPFKSHAGAVSVSDEIQRMRHDLEHDNCAFQKIEILPGNIGYVKFDAFRDPAVCGPTASSAMSFLMHADALIFDLRNNGGGDPEMVRFIASYLFDKPTHLNDLHTREGNTTHQYWTSPSVSVIPFTKQPVYVLTSNHTFSAAEEFSYDLQAQKRAIIVGDTTGGAAHPVSGHLIADYFVVGVPWGSAINPLTEKSWEGTGVEPDVKVPAADALSSAEKLALAKITSK